MPCSPDLHTHSTASDGTLTPAALVARAAAAGVTLLALTDHDTLEGLPEAEQAASEHGIAFVPGVEVSVLWDGRTIHIVGLDIDRQSAPLIAGLAQLRHTRETRAVAMADKLEQAGYPGALEGARRYSQGNLIGRMHFARFLVSRGAATDVRAIFKRFLVAGKPGYVRGEWVDLATAVGWIQDAGGQAVLAHPARYGLTRTKLLRLVAEFRAAGGVGIEVVSGSHSRDDYAVFARHAREQQLLASAGSDYHGPETPWLELGQLPPLPPGCQPIWHHWTNNEHGAVF